VPEAEDRKQRSETRKKATKVDLEEVEGNKTRFGRKSCISGARERRLAEGEANRTGGSEFARAGKVSGAQREAPKQEKRHDVACVGPVLDERGSAD